MSEKTPLQKGMLVFAMLGMLGYLGSSAVGFFNSTEPASQSTPQSPEELEEQRLLAEEKGYEGVLEREPENQFALTQLVQLRVEMGKPQEAIAPLEKLVELTPDNPEMLQALAALHIQTGNPQGAIAPLEQLLELDPDQPEWQQTLEQLKQQIESSPQENSGGNE